LKKQQDFQAQTETLELQNRLRGKKIKRTCKFRLTTTKISIAKPRYIERIRGSPRERERERGEWLGEGRRVTL
jgi:hypothetical protein